MVVGWVDRENGGGHGGDDGAVRTGPGFRGDPIPSRVGRDGEVATVHDTPVAVVAEAGVHDDPPVRTAVDPNTPDGVGRANTPRPCVGTGVDTVGVVVVRVVDDEEDEEVDDDDGDDNRVVGDTRVGIHHPNWLVGVVSLPNVCWV